LLAKGRRFESGRRLHLLRRGGHHRGGADHGPGVLDRLSASPLEKDSRRYADRLFAGD